MVDSRFLIVTTLCYVGIFAVIVIVCCCAWTRYLKNEGHGSSRFRKKQKARSSGRRLLNTQNTQPPEYATASTPMWVPERHNFPEQNVYFPVQRTNNSMQRTNLYPMVSHYPMFDYQRGNFYPTCVTTGTFDVEVNVDAASMAYGDTSQGCFSGEDFSDATSSRFDGAEIVRVGIDEGEKDPPQTPETITPSVESGDEKTQVDSDATSRA